MEEIVQIIGVFCIFIVILFLTIIPWGIGMGELFRAVFL